MNEATVKLLEKAQRAIAAGDSSLADGFLEAGASRAYYAMFHVAQALLNERGLRFRKHGGVHGGFGQQFAKTGLMDPRYHQWLLAAFAKRVTADYGVDAELTAAEVATLLDQGRQFLAAARSFLQPDTPHPDAAAS